MTILSWKVHQDSGEEEKENKKKSLVGCSPRKGKLSQEFSMYRCFSPSYKENANLSIFIFIFAYYFLRFKIDVYFED